MVATYSVGLASVASVISPGGWVDVGCVLLLLVYMVTGLLRGLAAQVSGLLGLLIAVSAGYWLYPPAVQAVQHVPQAQVQPWFGQVLPYVVVVLAALLLFLLLRRALRHFFKLIVEQPMDRLFGMLAGAASGLCALAVVFSAASLLPPSDAQRALCEQSSVGRQVVPVMRNALRADWEKLGGRSSTGPQPAARRTATVRQAPSTPARPATARPVRPATNALSRAATARTR